MKKRFAALFLTLCVGVFIFILGARSLSLPDVGSMSTTEAMRLRQVITADSTNSRTIMWQSEVAEKNAFVEYKIEGTEQVKSSAAADDKFVDDSITTYLHSVTLMDLIPNTRYEYRVGYGDKRSPWHDFATAGLGQFKAIIFPDSQSSDYHGWENMAQKAWKANKNAAFFINMGDLVDNGEDHTQWGAWFDSMHGIIDRIPVVPLMGNHETYDLNWKVRMPVAYLNLFSLPGNGSKERRNQYYSFDYGDVHFMVLNTQMEEMEQFQPGLLETEVKWFKNDIAKSNKKWKVILMHKDVLVYAIKNRDNRKAGISDIGKVFMPLFDQYGVDIVLTAHLHTYRNRGNIYNFERATKGPLYILTGVAGDVRYPNLWENHPFDVLVAPQPETDNYMTLEASADTLHFASFLAEGKQIDNIEIKK